MALHPFVFGDGVKSFGKFQDVDILPDLFEVDPHFPAMRDSHKHPSMRVTEIEMQVVTDMRLFEQGRFAGGTELKPERRRLDREIAGKYGPEATMRQCEVYLILATDEPGSASPFVFAQPGAA